MGGDPGLARRTRGERIGGGAQRARLIQRFGFGGLGIEMRSGQEQQPHRDEDPVPPPRPGLRAQHPQHLLDFRRELGGVAQARGP